MDHRFLNYEVPPFDKVVPTAENVAAEIWRRLEPHFEAGRARLNNVRLYETEDLYVDYAGARGAPSDASHAALPVRGIASAPFGDRLTEEENRELVRQMQQPLWTRSRLRAGGDGRGSASIRPSGQVVHIPTLDRLVSEQVLKDFDHRYLNADRRRIRDLVPTSENIIRVIEDRLKARWRRCFPGEWPRLEGIRLQETRRNRFELSESENKMKTMTIRESVMPQQDRTRTRLPI